MNSLIPGTYRIRHLLPFCLLICSVLFGLPLRAQEQPPKPIQVTVSIMQNLSFGSFCAGNGIGTTVVITPENIRDKTGNIVLLGSVFSPALYDVEAIPGTIINIVNSPNVILNGPSLGTLTLQIGDSYPRSPFIASGEHTWVTIGGTLIIGSSLTTPAGAYSGEFTVIFMQE